MEEVRRKGHVDSMTAPNFRFNWRIFIVAPRGFLPVVSDMLGGSSFLSLDHPALVVEVVMSASVDPVGEGLVTTLARPGGNFTG